MAKNLSNPQQIQKEATKARKRTRDLENSASIKRPRKRLRTQDPPQTKLREQVEKQKQLQEEGTPDQKPDTKRKRKQKKCSQDELSEYNLRIWEKMNGAASNTRPGTTKRSSSRRSLTSDATQETGRSQRSSGSLALYRFTHLANVEVYIHVDPSKDIQNAIDAIIKAEPTDDRRKQLKSVSQAFSHGCREVARAAVGEMTLFAIFSLLFRLFSLTTSVSVKRLTGMRLSSQLSRSPISIWIF